MPDETIQAIETSYAGCRFRSRLEARWAVFFDHLGIEWEYEPQGFTTPAGRYLPDFRIRVPQIKDYGQHHQWFEVKPPGAVADPRHVELATTGPMIVARGMPRSYHAQMRGWGSPLLAYGIDCGAWPVAFCDSTTSRAAQYCALGDNRHWCQEDMNNTLDDRCHLALYGCHAPAVAEHDAVDDEDLFGEGGRWPDEMLDGFMTHPPYEAHNVDAAYAAARSARFEHGETPGARRA